MLWCLKHLRVIDASFNWTRVTDSYGGGAPVICLIWPVNRVRVLNVEAKRDRDKGNPEHGGD